MKTNGKRQSSWQRAVLWVLCVVLALILAFLLFLVGFVENKLGMINRVDPNEETLSSEEIDSIQNGGETDPDFTGEEIDPDDVTWDSRPADAIGGDDIINILLIGQDRRPGEKRARSDAMILCTVNKANNTLTLTSFMRDLYVQIPGYQDNKINASYALGGMKLLDKTLAENFGIQIDGNVEVDFTAFQKLIDKMGGIDVELTKAEAAYLNRRGNWDMRDGKDHGGWHLSEGVNHLTGDQALAYCRIRKVGNGDFGRTDRQRKVLSTLFEEIQDMNLLQINGLLDEILPLVTTDMTNKEITGYVMELFPILTDCTMNTLQIPAEGAYRMGQIRGMSVLFPKLEKNREVLKEALAG